MQQERKDILFMTMVNIIVLFCT